MPAQRYAPSPRAFPEPLPAIEYAPGEIVRKVQAKGELFFRGRIFRISKALRDQPVALRPTLNDGQFAVHFRHQNVATIDLRHPYE
ncbi:MAG TPA: hypothetical protein VFB20_02755 [Burkholderiales bacterium]|nr:hypothetical protein [Burkholderiales bacterium]